MISFLETINFNRINLDENKNLGFADDERGYVLLLNNDVLSLDDLNVLRNFALEKNSQIIEDDERLKQAEKSREHYDPDDDLIANLIVNIYRNKKLIKMVEERISRLEEFKYPKEAEYYFKKLVYLNRKIDLARKENKMAECEYLYMERDETVCELGDYKYNIKVKVKQK